MSKSASRTRYTRRNKDMKNTLLAAVTGISYLVISDRCHITSELSAQQFPISTATRALTHHTVSIAFFPVSPLGLPSVHCCLSFFLQLMILKRTFGDSWFGLVTVSPNQASNHWRNSMHWSNQKLTHSHWRHTVLVHHQTSQGKIVALRLIRRSSSAQ